MRSRATAVLSLHFTTLNNKTKQLTVFHLGKQYQIKMLTEVVMSDCHIKLLLSVIVYSSHTTKTMKKSPQFELIFREIIVSCYWKNISPFNHYLILKFLSLLIVFSRSGCIFDSSISSNKRKTISELTYAPSKFFFLIFTCFYHSFYFITSKLESL